MSIEATRYMKISWRDINGIVGVVIDGVDGLVDGVVLAVADGVADTDGDSVGDGEHGAFCKE